MALTRISIQNILTRERNKHSRQTEAVETTVNAIKLWEEQLEMFDKSPVSSPKK